MTSTPPTSSTPDACDVIIIGAGLSGLTAAHVLFEAGVNVVVLEAAGEVGGRIRSLRDEQTGEALADLGPTWVWPEFQPVAAKWLNQLDLDTFAQFDAGDTVIDNGPDTRPARQNIPGQYGSRRIPGGPVAIIRDLAGRLPDGAVRTNAAVTGVTGHAGGVDIATGGTSPAILRARYVIAALPLRVAITAIDWTPALDTRLIDAAGRTPTWMSVHAKAVAVYDRPFWRDQGLSGGLVSRTGPLVEAHDHSGADGTPAALFGFVGYPHDLRAQLGDQLRPQIIAQLTRCFGPEAAHPVAFQVEDWATNDRICTDLDRSGPMHHPDIAPQIVRHRHCGDRVLFAAAETSTVSPGLIEGAFNAGNTAATGVLRLLSV